MIRLLVRDMRLSVRHGGDTVAALLFFVLVAALFPLAIGPAPETLGRIAPGVIWVAALLAALLPLDRLLGATVRIVPRDSSLSDAVDRAADEVKRAGGKPYVIPGGGSNAVGALGYVGCALEMLQQAGELGFGIDRVVHATGSSGTQAGLIAGFDGARSGVRVLGITVGRPRDNQEKHVAKLLDETWAHLGLEGPAPRDTITADDRYFGEAYGIPTPAMKEAVSLLAATEGVLLDPVYAGKAMSGLIDLVRQGTFGKDENIVFVHTGGQAGLFAYEPAFTA